MLTQQLKLQTSKEAQSVSRRDTKLTRWRSMGFDFCVYAAKQRSDMFYKQRVGRMHTKICATKWTKQNAYLSFDAHILWWPTAGKSHFYALHVICTFHFWRKDRISKRWWFEKNTHTHTHFILVFICSRKTMTSTWIRNEPRNIGAHFADTQCNYARTKKREEIECEWSAVKYIRNFILRNEPFQQHSIDAIIASSLKKLLRSFLLI